MRLQLVVDKGKVGSYCIGADGVPELEPELNLNTTLSFCPFIPSHDPFYSVLAH